MTRAPALERDLLPSTPMTPSTKTPLGRPEPQQPEDVDFAEEAGPKETEFGTEKHAKELTSGGFDPIP